MWVEATGKTVEDALQVALADLGVEASDAEIIVVEEPRRGLLGLRRADARVRVRVRPALPRPKRQSRPRRKQRTGQPVVPASPAATSSPDTLAKSSPSKSSPREGDRLGAANHPGARGARSAKSAAGAVSIEEEHEMSIEDQAKLATDFVEGLVRTLGLSARTVTEIGEDATVDVRVEGDDLGFLIGPRGATLAAVQELTRTVTQRHGDERGTRLSVDIAGYRARRTEALKSFVQGVAAEVAETGEAKALEPMSPADRKVVHDTVNGIFGVMTTSEGVEPRRYVVVRPTGADDEEPEEESV